MPLSTLLSTTTVVILPRSRKVISPSLWMGLERTLLSNSIHLLSPMRTPMMYTYIGKYLQNQESWVRIPSLETIFEKLKLFLILLPRCRHAAARPYGFKINFVRNPISKSIPRFFVIILNKTNEIKRKNNQRIKIIILFYAHKWNQNFQKRIFLFDIIFKNK